MNPELPFPVVRILVQVLLDRYRAVRRFLGVFLFDLVTRGRSRRLRGGRPTADADTAGNSTPPATQTTPIAEPPVRLSNPDECSSESWNTDLSNETSKHKFEDYGDAAIATGPWP
jgi:hypothetical protein